MEYLCLCSRIPWYLKFYEYILTYVWVPICYHSMTCNVSWILFIFVTAIDFFCWSSKSSDCGVFMLILLGIWVASCTRWAVASRPFGWYFDFFFSQITYYSKWWDLTRSHESSPENAMNIEHQLFTCWFFLGNIEIYLHFLQFLVIERMPLFEIIPLGRKDPFIHHGCWWSGEARRQGISSHIIDLVLL